jgi:uncharacterized protein YbjT (DUF2867 family)
MQMAKLVAAVHRFLGRNVIKYLVERGIQVHAIARSDASTAVVREAGATPYAGDLGDVQAMAAAMQGCDTVVHCAAAVCAPMACIWSSGCGGR